MDKINVIFTYELDNGKTHNVTIRDVNQGASETEINALGNKLIEKESQYNGSLFKSVVKTVKVTTMEEIL